MSATAPLVVELLTEELPPKALKILGEAFAQSLAAGLSARGFTTSESQVMGFATPRRLAVAITNVASEAPDSEVKEKLVPRSVAEGKDGKPTVALIKRLEKLGRATLAEGYPESWNGPDHLYIESDGKAEYVWLRRLAKGQPLARGLQESLDQAIEGLPIPKVMRYAQPPSAGRQAGYFNAISFVRPAHKLLALHGGDVVPVTALGLAADRRTDGHRFLSRKDIEIATANAYEPELEAEGKVIPSFAKRRAAIVTALAKAAQGATVIRPDALLDEVASLVEWPVVYAGTFDPAFLDVPQECLILTMQQNQKYFALADAEGKLANRFLLVSNLAAGDPSAIVQGNERVLRARLADARFFYDQDRKARLETRLPKLRNVVYQAKIGTQAERIERLRFLATRVAGLIGADSEQANRAAMLAKADLVTDMVGEFPELQGIMGRYYALHDGEAPAVADAIAQHYWPRFAGDALPEGKVAQAAALADKLEALAGLFGIGSIPTGDRDPFGLRRAALGVLRILIEKRVAVPLPDLVALAFDAFGAVPAVKRDVAPLLEFLLDRLRGHLREQGATPQQIEAVLAQNPARIDLVPDQLAAVQAFARLPEAEALSTANKRIVNILRKSGGEAAIAVDRSLLGSGAEHDLYIAFQRLEPAVEGHFAQGDYAAALKALAAAKPAVDRFFDDVMVMTDDPVVRANRLALLRGVAVTMNRVADISKLAT
jgi:glycyl-tRNA synthetase beta chain